MFWNYFSVGLDAKAAHDFHHLRENKPHLTSGRIFNQVRARERDFVCVCVRACVPVCEAACMIGCVRACVSLSPPPLPPLTLHPPLPLHLLPYLDRLLLLLVHLWMVLLH